ncbi:Kelch-like protein 2 [Cichlidogyrus casuarinus]|uniref:Kelch-like protein 2 n=1 Tax=Cichlidogyrus casuarinus TaxID=1844966 RepID=A0ABD2PS04_9PLAT
MLGGNKELTEHHVYSLLPNAHSWYQETRRKPYRMQASAVLVGTRIYMIGGIEDSSTCEYLETSNYWLRWRSCAEMFYKRNCTAAVAHEGRIYTFGGSIKDRPTRLVESYNPTKDKWTRLPTMPMATSCGAAAVLNNLIYVTGGLNELSFPETSVKLFDPTTWQWRVDISVQSTSFEHYDAPLMAFNGSLYIAGSSFSRCQNTRVEKYDPATNTWRLLPNDMIKNPSGIFTAVLK